MKLFFVFVRRARQAATDGRSIGHLTCAGTSSQKLHFVFKGRVTGRGGDCCLWSIYLVRVCRNAAGPYDNEGKDVGHRTAPCVNTGSYHVHYPSLSLTPYISVSL